MTWPKGSFTPAGGPGHGPPSGIPAKGTRPPFAPGNLARATSGARSPRVYGDLAQRLAAGLTEDRPDLGAYPEAVAAWATAEAQAALMRRHVAEVGPLDPDTGKPREAVLSWLTRLENAAARHRATLGLDPRSEAALARERAAASVLAVDLDALAERGRQALAQRETAAPDLAAEVLGQHLDAYAREREAAS
ncbi:hypothetical protein ACFQ0K_08625 [Nocardioides caeni]|uniref:Uncharacterized protein n=1 Tax=Nocardioides caeni TaxID=574700 RepID=A0A4S8N374_9ACTN|nr:hypothetical protein [Nocardioides caeni]THV10463.1 hypothetical protein E9934_14125 [Nocardioides caeni]